jgi:hypothetical protein
MEKWQGSISKIKRIETERPEFGGNSGSDGDEDGVSGTLMREFWLAKDFDRFSQGIPEGQDPKKVWMILGGKLEEDLLTPELFRSRTVSNPDMDVNPPDRAPQRVGGTTRIPAQWGTYKGGRQELGSNPGSGTTHVKSFSDYISDK